MLTEVRPEVLNPPAIVVQAFDEKKALAEIRTAIEQRDESKAGYRTAILDIGSWLATARRSMPGAKIGKVETYSPAFKEFVAATGLSLQTARIYMGYARNPGQLSAQIKRNVGRASRARRAVLTEIVKAVDNGHPLDEILAAIRKELDEPK